MAPCPTYYAYVHTVYIAYIRPVTSFDTRRGEEFSEWGPNFLNYVQ